MNEKRFSVFISSTFDDLRKERQAVQDAVLGSGDFPVQMENFPAADMDQFEFIKSLIDKCDYYVLVIAGRYGTMADGGMSYTEKEYRYAGERGIPILVMLHGDRGSIPASKTEKTDAGRDALEAFIQEVSTGRLRKTWTTMGELMHAVRDALDHAKATQPGIGWVRGNTSAQAEILNELNEVRKDNERLRESIGHFDIEGSLPSVPDPQDLMEIDLLRNGGNGDTRSETSGSYARVQCKWIDLFPIVMNALSWGVREWSTGDRYFILEDPSCHAIGSAIASEIAPYDTSGLFTIKTTDLNRLKSYFIEIGLMYAEGPQPFTIVGTKVARRVRVSNDGEPKFVVIKGML